MFEYKLTNVKHDNTYKNAPYFNNVTDRNNALIQGDFTETLHNFNFGNILYTSVVVNTYNFENYFILKDNNNYRFYFITNAEYLSVNQWRLSLELDVITMYINGVNENTFANCLVNRAHIDRFIKVNDYTVEFDLSNDSEIIKSENVLNKIISERKKVKIDYHQDEAINNWLNSNIVCWCYAIVDVNHTYNTFCLNVDGSGYAYGSIIPRVQDIYGNLYNDFSVVCVPIYKYNKSIYLIDSVYDGQGNVRNVGIDIENLEGFLETNEQFNHVYTVKLSNVPPVDFSEFYCRIVDGYLTIGTPCTIDTYLGVDVVTKWDMKTAEVVAQKNAVSEFTETIEGVDVTYRLISGGTFFNVNNNNVFLKSVQFEQIGFSFPISQVKGNRKKAYEPKILLDCYDIVLRDSSSGEFRTNALYNGSNQYMLQLDAPIEPTQTSSYYRILPSLFGIIPRVSNKDWTGVVNSVNTSTTVVDDNYKSFINNNKNFFMLKILGQIPNLLGIASGNIGSVLSLSQNVLGTYSDIENIKNKRNNLLNTNDSLQLLLQVNEGLNLYVDLEKARDIDIDKYYDNLYAYGYTINKFCNPFDYINTRKYFNYLQCEVEKINVNLPDNVENKIKDIFRNGVRLWNDYQNMYNYTKENYEKFMD